MHHQKLHLSANPSDQDCGCATIQSGRLSEKAKLIDPRQAISKSSLLTLNGDQVRMGDILPMKGVSLLIFMRSFG